MRCFALEGKHIFDLLNQGNDEIQTLNNWKWLQQKHQTPPGRPPAEPAFPRSLCLLCFLPVNAGSLEWPDYPQPLTSGVQNPGSPAPLSHAKDVYS